MTLVPHLPDPERDNWKGDETLACKTHFMRDIWYSANVQLLNIYWLSFIPSFKILSGFQLSRSVKVQVWSWKCQLEQRVCENLLVFTLSIYVLALSDQLAALRSLTLISLKNTAARAKSGPRIKYPDYSEASHVCVDTLLTICLGK